MFPLSAGKIIFDDDIDLTVGEKLFSGLTFRILVVLPEFPLESFAQISNARYSFCEKKSFWSVFIIPVLLLTIFKIKAYKTVSVTKNWISKNHALLKRMDCQQWKV